MSIRSRMLRILLAETVIVSLLVLAAQVSRAADAPHKLQAPASAQPIMTSAAPWTERNGTYLLPEVHGAQLALVAFVYPANHRVLYGFRETPQRANCAAGSIGRGQTFDIEGVRMTFTRECVRGVGTLIPANVPSKRMFASILSRTQVLHLRTASFFPLTYDVSSLPELTGRLQLAAMRGSNDRRALNDR